MLRSVVSGILALLLVVAFFAVVLLKIQEPVLWIVVGIGIAMMIWNIIDGMRTVSAASDLPESLPEGQQEREGVS